MVYFYPKLFDSIIYLAILFHAMEAVSLDEFQHTLKIVGKTCRTHTNVPEGTNNVNKTRSNHVNCFLFHFHYADVLQKVRNGDYVDDPAVKVNGMEFNQCVDCGNHLIILNRIYRIAVLYALFHGNASFDGWNRWTISRRR